MNSLNEYLKKVIYNCNYDITFIGGKQCSINKWAVKSVRYTGASPDSNDPVLKTECAVTVAPDYKVPEQLKEHFWRYYLSAEVKYSAYQDNCPDLLFKEKEDRHIYCLCALYCMEEQDAYVYINGETPLKVWINGELTAKSLPLYHIKPFTLLHKFKKGMNTILVEKNTLMEYVQIRDQTFAMGINPLRAMEKDSNKRFIDDFMLSSLENSCYVLPDQAFFRSADEIGVTVLERFYTAGQTHEIQLQVVDCFEKIIFSKNAKTKERILFSINGRPEGACRIEAIDLTEGKRMGFSYIYIGSFEDNCKGLKRAAADRLRDPAQIEHALDCYAEIPDTKSGCYKLAPELMNQRLYNFLLEKVAEIYAAVYSAQKLKNRNILNVFQKSALLFQKSRIDGGSLGYGIFLPKNYSPDKQYSLVVVGAYGYAASRYPLPVPYMLENEFEDGIILNVLARGDLEHEYIYEISLKKLLTDTMNYFHIKRNSIYFIGVCVGAKAAFSLALKMPDFFAGMGFVFGPTLELTLSPYLPLYAQKLSADFRMEHLKMIELNETYIDNADNLPAYYLACLVDFTVNTARNLFVASRLKRFHTFYLQDFAHDEFDEVFNSQKLVQELIQKKKEEYPKEISFTSYYRKYNKSYWIRIEARTDYKCQSFLQAGVDLKKRILVRTENIKSFTLLLNRSKLGLMNSVTIVVNHEDITVQMEDYAKILIHETEVGHTAALVNLNREDFEELYFASGPDEKDTGLKQVYLNKCMLIMPDAYKADRRVDIRKMFTLLSNPLSTPIRSYFYETAPEDDVDMEDISDRNFILVADTRKLSHFQQMILEDTAIVPSKEKLTYKNKIFQGEYYALIKGLNPVNRQFCTMLVLFNSDRMQQKLTGDYAMFQYDPMFESDAVIYNKDTYVCLGE